MGNACYKSFVIVLFTALVAILVPNVGLLIALAGASSGATLSMILPPLIDWKISTSSLGWKRDFMNSVSILVGTIGAVIGTVLALIEV